MEDFSCLKKLTDRLNQHEVQDIQFKATKDSERIVTPKTFNLDVGGTIFKTLSSTAKSIPGSLLSQLDETSPHYNSDGNVYYFDRNAILFQYILDAHRDMEVHVPKDVCMVKFKKEINFWGIPYRMLSPCCWRQFYESDNELSTLNDLARYVDDVPTITHVDVEPVKDCGEKQVTEKTDYGNKHVPVQKDYCKEGIPVNKTTGLDLKTRLWLILEEPKSSKAAMVWYSTYIGVVILSTITYMIWLDPQCRVDIYLSSQSDLVKRVFQQYARSNATATIPFSDRIITIATTDPHHVLFIIDCFCIVFFWLEVVLHFCSCPNKRQYFKNPYYLIKFILAVCLIPSSILEIRKDLFVSENVGKFYFSMKSTGVCRLLLIFRLRKVYSGLQTMLLALERSCKELFLLILMFVILIILYGCLIFSCEIETDAFPTVRVGMWWALVTMTTVGYGDYYPTTPMGHIAGAICAINGLIVIALPIAAIASNFSDFASRGSDLNKHLAAVRKSSEKDKFVQIDNSKHGEITNTKN